MYTELYDAITWNIIIIIIIFLKYCTFLHNARIWRQGLDSHVNKQFYAQDKKGKCEIILSKLQTFVIFTFHLII